MSLLNLTADKLLEILPSDVCRALVDQYMKDLYLPKIKAIGSIFSQIMDRDDSWQIFLDLCEAFPECISLQNRTTIVRHPWSSTTRSTSRKMADV